MSRKIELLASSLNRRVLSLNCACWVTAVVKYVPVYHFSLLRGCETFFLSVRSKRTEPNRTPNQAQTCRLFADATTSSHAESHLVHNIRIQCEVKTKACKGKKEQHPCIEPKNRATTKKQNPRMAAAGGAKTAVPTKEKL